MKIDCNVIRDLLPLYADGACSEESRVMVEEHLQECQSCSDLLLKIRKTEIDESLVNEKNEVIQYGAARLRRRSAAVGSAFSLVFIIPILIFLFVKITFASPLGLLLVVLASLCVAASLVIVPLMAAQDRAFWTFCSFCASLILLFAVVCLYTGGRWFWVASSATLFGLSIVFMPFVVRSRPVRQLTGGASKVLVVLGVDAVLFVSMMNAIRAYNRHGTHRTLLVLGIIAGIVLLITQIRGKKGNENE